MPALTLTPQTPVEEEEEDAAWIAFHLAARIDEITDIHIAPCDHARERGHDTFEAL